MNEPNPHKNFQTRKDYAKWDNFVEQIDAINLSDWDKKRARKAIEYLRINLGEHFLADIIQNGHPLLSYYFINAANLARIQLIDFAESLESLENSPNFHTLIDKIRKAKKFSEGITILQTAHRFYNAGLSVAFDIKVTFSDGAKLKTKEPDIKLVNGETGEEIYVEVSEVRESQISVDNGRTFHIIFNLIHDAIRLDPEMTDFANPKYALPYVQIHRSLTEEEIADVAVQIKHLFDKVRKTGEFQELIIEETIEICVSPFHDHTKAKEWALQRKMTDFVEGPSFRPNDLDRVVNSIVRELDQLPKDKPGIINLWNNGNLLFFLYDISTIINKVADKIAWYPNLFCVALHYEYGVSNSEIKFVEKDEHFFVSDTGRDLITKTTLVIRNMSFNLVLTESAKEKICNGLKNLVKI